MQAEPRLLWATNGDLDCGLTREWTTDHFHLLSAIRKASSEKTAATVPKC
jgi:hypothetical protein